MYQIILMTQTTFSEAFTMMRNHSESDKSRPLFRDTWDMKQLLGVTGALRYDTSLAIMI